MSRKTVFAEGEFYHLYNRGTEKRNIFTSKADYKRFLSLLYLCNNLDTIHVSDHQDLTLTELLSIPRKGFLVDICIYCLMPNHFHLLVKEKKEGGISRFMQKLLTGYTMYFNKLHDRSGTLFQSKFKAQHADDDRYLKYLIAYIHLNPIKIYEPTWKESGISNRKGAEKFLEEYQYSSFLDYSERKRPENVIINKLALPNYSETPTKFKDSIIEWLSFKDTNFSAQVY